jgi:hypothetical protein
MSIKVYAGISLRRSDGIHFGTLVRRGRGRAGITTDAVYRQGDFLEFQLELSGWDRTVTGIAEVARADIRGSRLNRYLLRILEMRRPDRETLQSWYLEQIDDARTASSPGLMDSQVGSEVPSRIQRELPRVVHEPAPVSNWGNDASLTISQTVEHQGSRRQALRAVLRAAYGEPEPVAAVANPGPHGPVASVYLELAPPLIELRYRGVESWRVDWDAWLHQGLVFVPHRDRLPVIDQEINVRLVVKGLLDLTCPARVVVLHPTGFGANLDLDPHQHEALRDVGAEDATSPAMAVARAVAYKAQQAATTPIDRAFWSRLFGLEGPRDPLDAAVEELVDPLALLEMDSARDRRELDAILARADEDYLVLCDEVGRLLTNSQWRWPELEDCTRHARDPMAQAAAFVVLAHVTRIEAIQALRRAAARAQEEPALVELGAAGERACPRCRTRHGRPTTPARLARRGLPPFHLGCQCRVTQVPDPPG